MEMTSTSYHIPKPFLNSSCYTSVGVSTICISRCAIVVRNRSPRNRKYNPDTVRNKVLDSQGAILSLVGRGVEIIWKLGFYWTRLVYDFLVGRDEEVVLFRARQLRNILCDLGPPFIKAGQVLANRPDIIREDY